MGSTRGESVIASNKILRPNISPSRERYLGPRFKKNYANACFRSKLLYGIEAWGGVNKTLLSKLQAQQDIMTKLTLGKEGRRLSANQRQRILNWLPIRQEIEMAANKMTFRLISQSIPEELAVQMPCNLTGRQNHRAKETCH